MLARNSNPLGYNQQLKIVQRNLSFPVKLNDSWGLIRKDGQLMIPIEYDSISLLTGTLIQTEKNGIIRLFDLENNRELPFTCDTIYPLRVFANSYYGSNSYHIFRSNGKLGILNSFTKKMLPSKYDQIEQGYVYPEFGLANYFIEDGYFSPNSLEKGNTDVHTSTNLIRYKLDEKYGIIKLDLLSEITDNSYNQIKINSLNTVGNHIFTMDGKMAFQLDNLALISAKFDSVSLIKTINNRFEEDTRLDKLVYYRIVENDKVGVYDSEGNCFIPLIYKDISQLLFTNDPNSYHFIAKNEKGKYGVLSSTGEALIPFKYDQIKYNANFGFSNYYEVIRNGISVFVYWEDI